MQRLGYPLRFDRCTIACCTIVRARKHILGAARHGCRPSPTSNPNRNPDPDTDSKTSQKRKCHPWNTYPDALSMRQELTHSSGRADLWGCRLSALRARKHFLAGSRSALGPNPTPKNNNLDRNPVPKRARNGSEMRLRRFSLFLKNSDLRAAQWSSANGRE